MESIKCKVRVEKVLYPKSGMENGSFAIVSLKVIKLLEGVKPIVNPYGCITVKGSFPIVSKDDKFIVIIDSPVVDSYGTNYMLSSVCVEIDEDNINERNNYIDLICPKVIATELKKLENGYRILKDLNEEELLKIKGVGNTTLNRISERVHFYNDISYAMVKLIPLGITHNQVSKICKVTGGAKQAVDLCFNNPYGLPKLVKGIGFKIADNIAMKIGINPADPKRIVSAIENALEIQGENGKSYLTIKQVVGFIIETLNFNDVNVIMECLVYMQKENLIVVSSDGNCVCSEYYYNLELNLANEIKRINSCEIDINVNQDWHDIISKKEKLQGWEYDEQQLKGIESMLSNNFTVVVGKAGTGKSTIVDALCDILNGYDIRMCCLSAKASQRLNEVTGRECSTIHKLLIDNIEDFLFDVLIIDEGSMVNGDLFLKVFQKCKNTKVIILGDDGQLTAIGNCSVFADLIEAKGINVVKLKNIHRQAKKSAIITQSLKIRNQQSICERGFRGKRVLGDLQDLELIVREEEELSNEIIQGFIEGLETTKDILEVQIIVPTKNRGHYSAEVINSIIQPLYNGCIGKFIQGYKKCEIYLGDKIINTKNNYNSLTPAGENRPIWNGSIGIVNEIFDDKIHVHFQGIGTVVVDKEWFKFLKLAYAITIHSSQGSQWKNVICIISIEAYSLLTVELLYTGITRASEKCKLITSEKALSKGTRTVEQKTKQTLLTSFIT